MKYLFILEISPIYSQEKKKKQLPTKEGALHQGPLPVILNSALSEKKTTGEYLTCSYIWSLALVYLKKIQLSSFQNNVIEVFLLGCCFGVVGFFYF